MSSTIQRYCRDDVVRFPAGDGLLWVYSKLKQKGQLLPSSLVKILDQCGTFRTLDEHTRECYHVLSREVETYDLEQSNQARISSIQNQLSELITGGLLISDAELRTLCRQNSSARGASPNIASVGIVTCNRLNSLTRCLISYIENSLKHGRNNDFVVMDDSERAEDRTITRQKLQSLAMQYNVEISYAGLEEKQHFASLLISECGLPSDVVNFALFDPESYGCSIGKNRNALLLHTAGDIVFSADDDTVCCLSAAPQSHPGLALDAHWKMIKFWFFPDRASALKPVSFSDKDLLAIHEQLLGRNLQDCVSTFDLSSGLHFDEINARPLSDIQHGRGRVRLTFTGLIGDTAMPAPTPYLMLSDESRQRLTQSKADYLTACTRREVWRVIDRPAVSVNAWCATTAFGCDNRTLLPPFIPIGQGEDDLWGATVQMTSTDSYFGYLPWTILHAPLESRSYLPGGMTWAAGLSVSDIFSACLKSANSSHGITDDSARLRSLGEHLIALGSLPQADWEEFVRLKVWQIRGEFVSYLEDLLERYEGQPDFWAEDVRAFVDASRNAFAGEDYLAPKELIGRVEAKEARSLTHRLVRQYGQLLCWWPQIVEAAGRLRSRGHRLAQRVPAQQ